MKIINKEHICSIEVVKDKVNQYFTYYKERKYLFGLIKKPEGFYNTLFGDLITKIPKNMYVKDDKLFTNPHIIINFSNGNKECIYFNNEKEILSYINKEFNNHNWRKLENE